MSITPGGTYEEVYDAFEWKIPEHYNIADDVCDRHADDPSQLALVYEREDGNERRFNFRQIQQHANGFANVLTGLGLERGDRVSLILSQDPEAAIAHVACWKAGLVSCQSSVLFGADAIEYRLRDSGARVVVTDRENHPKVMEVRSTLPALENVFLIDGEGDDALSFWRQIEGASEHFQNVRTRADEPAFINYTSGTTGPPKGSVQPHSILLGHMPGLEFVYDFFPQEGDVLWSPADWAWLAGLCNILLAGWFHGAPVVASDMKRFDPERTYRILADHGVRVALLTPTMLKLMRQVPDPLARYDLKLRVVLSGTESVGTELLEWSRTALGVQINEGFGQTECNPVLGNNAHVMPVKPGSLGRALPGRICAIVDDEGEEMPRDSVGNIAVKRPDPVMLLEYLNRPDATREKFVGDWLITGDLGTCDEDGYFWFRGRADDVITSSGYRIGPSEIEDALLRHPAVAMAAAIGVPDPVRTEAIKAFIVLAEGHAPDDALALELQESVRTRLAKHEVPRSIEFVESLPLTTTGKILRRELRQREAVASGG